MAMSDKTTAPIPVRKIVEGIPEDLPPEELERLQKIHAKLAQFVLHLIQAFLRTGYYTPDHPESKKAKDGLYQLFRELFETEDELAFLVREEQGKAGDLCRRDPPRSPEIEPDDAQGDGRTLCAEICKIFRTEGSDQLDAEEPDGAGRVQQFCRYHE